MFKLAGEREREEEHQRGEHGDEAGRLQLESPSELAATGAQNEQHGDDDPEGDEDAEGVDEAVAGAGVSFSSPEDLSSARPLRKSTGKTQGIRLRMMPPRKARPMAAKMVTLAGVTCLAALAAGVRPDVTTPGVTGAVSS